MQVIVTMTTRDIINNATLPERVEMACLHLCSWLMRGDAEKAISKKDGIYTALERTPDGLNEWQASSLMELVEAMQRP